LGWGLANKTSFGETKKQKHRTRLLAHDAFIFLFRVTEATVKGFGGSRMYTLEPPILYSETVSAESVAPVSIQNE